MRAAWRGYERFVVARQAASDGHATAEDGWPVPPGRVIALTIRPPTGDFYLASGRADFELMRRMLDGTEPTAVLDFGCGCGRVGRWWASQTRAAVSGCDVNPVLTRWCEENLPSMKVARTRLEPPLPYDDGQFDFVYAISVITHLSLDLQRGWLDELARVVRPGGQVFLTAMGELYLPRLTVDEAARFGRGEPVARFEDASGSNACSVYHPAAAVRALAAEHGFGVDAVVAATSPVSPPNMGQDAYLLRRAG